MFIYIQLNKREHFVMFSRGHINVISTCSFSSDEHLLATGSWDKNIQLWDVATGMYRTKGPMTLSKGHEGSISACEFSKDGKKLLYDNYGYGRVVNPPG